MATTAPSSGIQADQGLVNAYLQTLLCARRGHEGSVVHEAMRYAVLGTAQRIRPVLALRVARLLDCEDESVLRAAASVELLHCASLIVDDLPCMDNEEFRRDRATVHVRFGEATAVLAAFALVALAARSLVEHDLPARQSAALLRFQVELLRVLDCSALIGGQALDLRLSGVRRDEDRARVAQLKTVPLFQLAVRAGALLAELDMTRSAAIHEFGNDYGAAFQMTDDYLDGESFTLTPLTSLLEQARCRLRLFGPASFELEGLLDYLHARAWQKAHCHR